LKRYDEKYFSYELENEEQFFHLAMLGLGDVGFDRIDWGMRNGNRFLDIGCATGLLLEHMRDEKGWDVQGVEVCGEAVEYGRKQRRLSIFHGTVEDAHFPGGSFDLVHASHVIEHVTDPKAFLRELRRLLRPGGYLVVSTPNIDGFQSRLFKERWRSAIPDHMVLFSKRTLQAILSAAGFTVLRKKTWGGIAVGITATVIKNSVDRLAKFFGFGDVMILLARKQDGTGKKG
jgi:2-polyprenyl-3-methyl-5-hydroxy-6-metoxy-1,4-benzoquinol methylase